MASVYILSDHGKLAKRDETIVFSQPDGTSTILFPFKTEHLVVVGKVSISAEALRLLTKYKIGTTFLSSNGRFTGRLSFGDSKNIFLRQRQFRILDDAQRSLEIAKSIVAGKIRNEISFMQRIKRKSAAENRMLEEAINSVKNTLGAVERTQDIGRLRGHEGFAARKYFSVFGLNVMPDWAEFKTRSKNPPKTNVNAVLSFLYTLLMYRVESAIESQGMDSCAGNLHALNYGKAALVFDLMEEFRTPVADAVCCSLFNQGTLKEEDFERVDFSEDDDDFPLEQGQEASESAGEQDEADKGQSGVLLTKAGLKKVVAAFEHKMDTLILYPPTNQRLSYAKIIYEQAIHYKRVVLGEEREYKAYYFK